VSDQQLGHVWRAAHFLDSAKTLAYVEELITERCTLPMDGDVFVTIAGPLSPFPHSNAWKSVAACFARHINTFPLFLGALRLDQAWCIDLCVAHATVAAPAMLKGLLKVQTAERRAAAAAVLSQKISAGAIEMELLVPLSRIAIDEGHSELLQRVVLEVEVHTEAAQQVPPDVLAALPVVVVQPLMFKMMAAMYAELAAVKASMHSQMDAVKAELSAVKRVPEIGVRVEACRLRTCRFCGQSFSNAAQDYSIDYDVVCPSVRPHSREWNGKLWVCCNNRNHNSKNCNDANTKGIKHSE
jgi:hypothetical protein